jgi:hypothetical protein
VTTQRTSNSEYFAQQITTPLVDKSIEETEAPMVLESKFTEIIAGWTFQK